MKHYNISLNHETILNKASKLDILKFIILELYDADNDRLIQLTFLAY